MKRYTEGLGAHRVEYASDFSTPLEDRPRKVPVVQVSAQRCRASFAAATSPSRTSDCGSYQGRVDVRDHGHLWLGLV
jgi:hypothetical protein